MQVFEPEGSATGLPLEGVDAAIFGSLANGEHPSTDDPDVRLQLQSQKCAAGAFSHASQSQEPRQTTGTDFDRTGPTSLREDVHIIDIISPAGSLELEVDLADITDHENEPEQSFDHQISLKALKTSNAADFSEPAKVLRELQEHKTDKSDEASLRKRKFAFVPRTTPSPAAQKENGTRQFSESISFGQELYDTGLWSP